MEWDSFEQIYARMKESFTQKSGIEPEQVSDIALRMQTVAEEIYALERNLYWLWQQAFVQSAGGEYLQLHAVQRGLSRKPAQPAEGSLVFSRAQALTYDVSIP